MKRIWTKAGYSYLSRFESRKFVYIIQPTLTKIQLLLLASIYYRLEASYNFVIPIIVNTTIVS